LLRCVYHIRPRKQILRLTYGHRVTNIAYSSPDDARPQLPHRFRVLGDEVTRLVLQALEHRTGLADGLNTGDVDALDRSVEDLLVGAERRL
jgi:hypothetical protein